MWEELPLTNSSFLKQVTVGGKQHWALSRPAWLNGKGQGFNLDDTGSETNWRSMANFTRQRCFQPESVWQRCEAAAASNLVSVMDLSSLPPLGLRVPGISAISPGLVIRCGKCICCALFLAGLGKIALPRPLRHTKWVGLGFFFCLLVLKRVGVSVKLYFFV